MGPFSADVRSGKPTPEETSRVRRVDPAQASASSGSFVRWSYDGPDSFESHLVVETSPICACLWMSAIAAACPGPCDARLVLAVWKPATWKHGWSKHGSSIKPSTTIWIMLEPCLLQPCFRVAGERRSQAARLMAFVMLSSAAAPENGSRSWPWCLNWHLAE